MSNRKPRKLIKKEDIDYFLKLKETDITLPFIMETFGSFNGKVKYNPYDEITIPGGTYKSPDGKYIIKNSFVTTVGSYILNVYMIQPSLMGIILYTNEEFTDKFIKKLNKKLSYAYMEDDITLEEFQKYLMKTQSAMAWCTVLSSNQTLTMLTLKNKIEPKKKELAKKYEKELADGNAIVAEQMEKELLNTAKDILKDDESYDWIRSGYRASWGNNIKNMYIMKGAMKDPITGKYNIALSSYSEGIRKEEYKDFANSLAAGPYSRAVKTSIGGYWEKLITSAYQHIQLQPEGSDCKTTRLLEVDFSKEDPELYMYSYIKEGSNYIELTSKNINKYKGKKVKIRFSSLCESKNGICHRCAGNFLYRLKIKNVGMVMAQLGSKLKNISMKAFHSSIVEYRDINVERMFKD